MPGSQIVETSLSPSRASRWVLQKKKKKEKKEKERKKASVHWRAFHFPSPELPYGTKSLCIWEERTSRNLQANVRSTTFSRVFASSLTISTHYYWRLKQAWTSRTRTFTSLTFLAENAQVFPKATVFSQLIRKSLYLFYNWSWLSIFFSQRHYSSKRTALFKTSFSERLHFDSSRTPRRRTIQSRGWSATRAWQSG